MSLNQDETTWQTFQRLWIYIRQYKAGLAVAVVALIGVQQYNQTEAPTVAPVAAVDEVKVNLEAPQLRSSSEFGIPPISARTVSATHGSPEQSYSAPRSVIQVREVTPDQVTREQVQAYLNGLMLQHTENAAMNTNQGMLPFARMPTDQD